MRLTDFKIFSESLDTLEDDKLLINTINAHSYNLAKKDKLFHQSLSKCDVLIPDGISIVWALRFLANIKTKKIAGADLFFHEMKKMQIKGGKVFFMGSTIDTLKKIKARASKDYPNVTIDYYSPPYSDTFTETENKTIVEKINSYCPDVLFIGMTAPKQEKWAFQNSNKLEAGHICSIGAVFDFYAGTIKRAPQIMISFGLEWFYRLIKEPKRMWKRYLLGNLKFMCFMLRERLSI
jgi:N-acetylglucosaminyldiphosphoundecaprenol N-acetyl-beta-D-mannosaminyltransferase